MTKTAYFDLASGASGDMIIAAVADAGRRLGSRVEDTISEAIVSLALDATVAFVDDERGGLRCLRAEVKTGNEKYAPAELRWAIESAAIPNPARRRALAGLDVLVRAEAIVHGVDPDDVHLHELGSADTAADLVGASVGLGALGVSEVVAAPVPAPQGWINSEHGHLPLPAPVTLEVLRGATLLGVDSEDELVTPTGAAILVAHDATFGPLPVLALQAVGVGGGTRDSQRPNICRVLVGERPRPLGVRNEECVLLETNIDDQTPQSIGYAIDALVQDGALDAWVTPIAMKKSRPAFQLSVLVRPADEARIAGLVFRRTTTLGLRRRETTRWALERSEFVVSLHDHQVRVKIARLGDEIVNVAPEFQDCAELAEKIGVAVNDLYADATAIARRALELD